VDPHCFDANPEPDPDPAQNLDADPDPDPGGGGDRSAKNVHPPWQNPRYAPGGYHIINNTCLLHPYTFNQPSNPSQLFKKGSVSNSIIVSTLNILDNSQIIARL
jgi:hypothetical protein